MQSITPTGSVQGDIEALYSGFSDFEQEFNGNSSLRVVNYGVTSILVDGNTTTGSYTLTVTVPHGLGFYPVYFVRNILYDSAGVNPIGYSDLGIAEQGYYYTPPLAKTGSYPYWIMRSYVDAQNLYVALVANGAKGYYPLTGYYDFTYFITDTPMVR